MQRLETLASQLHGTVLSAEWTGPDAERFRAEAQRLLTSEVPQIVGRIWNLGEQFEREAEEQDSASQGDGSAGDGASASGADGVGRPGLPSTGGPSEGPDPDDPTQWTGEPPYRVHRNPWGDEPVQRHPLDVPRLSPGEFGVTGPVGVPGIPGLPTTTLTPMVDVLSREQAVDVNNLPYNPQLFDYADPQVGQRIGNLEVVEKHDDGSITVFNKGEMVRMEPGAPLPGQCEQEVRGIMEEDYSPWNDQHGYKTLKSFDILPDGTIVQDGPNGTVELPPGATPQIEHIGSGQGPTTGWTPGPEEKVYEAPPAPYQLPSIPNPTLPEARR